MMSSSFSSENAECRDGISKSCPEQINLASKRRCVGRNQTYQVEGESLHNIMSVLPLFHTSASKSETYINCGFKTSQYRCYGGTDDRQLVKKTRLCDHDIQKLLVDLDEL